MKYGRGKKPARKGSIRLQFADIQPLFPDVEVPLVFGRTNAISQWGMLANADLQCCCQSGASHESMLWNAIGNRPIPTFTDATTITNYSESSGYVPGRPASDQGSDLAEFCRFRQKTGLIDAAGNRHKIDGYAALSAGDVDTIVKAAYLFGAIGLGLLLPEPYAEQQFDAQVPWDIEPQVITGKTGHYVSLAGRNVHGSLIVLTWGRAHAITESALIEWMDEGVVYLSFEMMRADTHMSQRGYDEAGLRAAFARFG